MALTLGEIAEMLELTLEGDPQTQIQGVCGIEEARQGEITFVANPKYAALLETTQASAVIVGPDVAVHGPAVLRSADPYLSFGRLLTVFAAGRGHHTGRHPSAIIAPTAVVDPSAALHAGVVIEADAVVEADAVLYPGVYVGAGSRIGTGTLIYSNVVIRERVHVGARVILHGGVVLGACGASAGSDGAPADGVGVIVADDVELGAHTTVDRGGERPTLVGAGTKVDNLVHVGAAATIGEACLIVAQVGISAGARIGDGVTVAGQATILPNVSVGNHAIITAKAGVETDVPEGALYSGTPARPHEEQRQVYAALRRLPRSRQRVLELERRLRTLEDEAGEQ